MQFGHDKKDKTLKNMMFRSLIVIFVIPLILVWISLIITSTKTIKENTIREQKNITHMLNLSIDQRLLEIQNAMEKMSMDAKIQAILRDVNRNQYDSELFNANVYVNKIISKAFYTITGVENVALVNFSGGVYSKNILNDGLKEYIQKVEQVKKRIFTNKGRSWVLEPIGDDPKDSSIVLSKPIMDLENVKFIGMVYVVYRQSEIQKLMEENLTTSVEVVILGADNHVVFQNNYAKKNKFVSELGERVDQIQLKASKEMKLKNRESIVTRSSNNTFNLSIMSRVKVSDIMGELFIRQLQIIVIFMVAVILVCILTKYIYKRINTDLSKLGRKQNKFSDSNTVYYELKQVDNTIVSLIQKNNEGQERIIKLVDRCESTTLDKLQAQINPHFLYNTLTSIKYIAIENNQLQISELISALVKLLRSTINRDGMFISVESEIQSTKDYMYIQNIVYKGNFKFSCEIQEQIMKEKIPNFILQPLLENSIFHGIRPDEYGGEISVRGYKENENIIFKIEDNGVGFDEESLHNIMSVNADSMWKNEKLTQLGIRGVLQKIQLVCGVKYGIDVTSEKGKGSVVTVTLPSAAVE